MHIRHLTPACLLGLALVAACSSEVAINSKSGDVASFKRNPVTQNLTMYKDVAGTPATAFDAACRALDALNYYRVGQNTDKTAVYARGPLDVYVEVDIGASKTAGDVLVTVSNSTGSLPDSQAIFAAILDQLNGAQSTQAAPAAGRGRRGG